MSWGKRSCPHVGEVWERDGELWLILEEVRYGWSRWDLEVWNLATGSRGKWTIAGPKAQDFWKRFA